MKFNKEFNFKEFTFTFKNEKVLILIFTLFFMTHPTTAQEIQEGQDKNICSLVMKMLGSATKCFSQISSNSGGTSILNFDSPKDVMALLTDSNRRACMAKCVMEDRGLITSEGKLNPSGFIDQQGSIPEEMRKKLSMTDFQPCIDISAKFDPNNCGTYMEFSQCALGVIVKAFDPSALDCFTKIPAVGPLFALLQSMLANRANNKDGSSNGFLNRMRERVSGVRGKVSDWVKDVGIQQNQNIIKLKK